MKRKMFAVMAAVLPTFSVAPFVLADADAAKKYLQTAKEEAANSDLDKAGNDIMLAETELDGVDAAAKDPIAKEIE